MPRESADSRRSRAARRVAASDLWRDRLVLAGILLLVFVLAGLAACGVESLRVQRTVQWSATAEVVLPEEWFQLAHHSAGGLASIEPEMVAEEILSGLPPSRSPESPDEAAPAPADRSATLPLPRPDREAMRRRLHVKTERTAGAMLCIGIRLSAADKDIAIRQANELAATYAGQLRLNVAREVLRRTAEVEAGRQRVERGLRQLRPQLDAIIDRAVSKTAAYRVGRDSFVPGTLETSPAAHNAGARTQLESQLDELRRRRERMLIDRRPVHPEIRQLDARIAETEEQLAAMPAPVGPVPEDTDNSEEPPEPIPAPQAIRIAPAAVLPVAPPSTELFQKIQTLQARVDDLVGELRRVSGPKIPAATSLLRGDEVGIQWADHADRIAADVQWRALLLVALAAGLVATAGVAMVWTGLRIDQPLLSGPGIERGLTLPVIGTIVVEQAVPENAERWAARARWKWPCILGGLAILTAYFAFLVQPFLGRG